MYIEQDEIQVTESWCLYKNLVLEDIEYYYEELFDNCSEDQWFFKWSAFELGWMGEDTDVEYKGFLLKLRYDFLGQSFLNVDTLVLGCIRYYELTESVCEKLSARDDDAIFVKDSIFIDFFEIRKEFRNSGLGEVMFKMFEKMFPGKVITLCYIDRAYKFWCNMGFLELEGTSRCEMYKPLNPQDVQDTVSPVEVLPSGETVSCET